MLSLAALQSPLWRVQPSAASISVRSGGATLIAADQPIAAVALDPAQQATAEVVGDREVLIRGRAMGETTLVISMKNGRSNKYRILVQAESAQTVFRSSMVR